MGFEQNGTYHRFGHDVWRLLETLAERPDRVKTEPTASGKRESVQLIMDGRQRDGAHNSKTEREKNERENKK
jgi:hypothetical protein